MGFNVFINQTPVAGDAEGIYLPSTPSRSKVLVNGHFDLELGKANVIKTASGAEFSLYLLADGTVYASGDNTYGQLGLGNTVSQRNPVQIPSFSNVKDIACSGYSSYFILENGSAYACGANTYGQLGLGTTTQKSRPAVISDLSNVKKIVGGGSYNSVKTFVLFLLENGTVYSSGINNTGALGLGDFDIRFSPTLISSLLNVKDIGAGDGHSFFVLSNGNLYACGENWYGQLGTGNTFTQSLPTHVSSLQNVKKATGGMQTSLILTENGDVYGCGQNQKGQLGLASNNSQETLIRISAISNALDISAGLNYSLFLINKNNNKTVYGCGDNSYGQLGIGTYVSYNIPIQVSLSNVREIFAANFGLHSFYLLEDGTVHGCGKNSKGQLGIGNTGDQVSPIQVVISSTSISSVHPDRSLLIQTKKGTANQYFTVFDNGLDASSNPLNKIRVSADKVYWTNPDTKLDESQPYSIVYPDGRIEHFAA